MKWNNERNLFVECLWRLVYIARWLKSECLDSVLGQIVFFLSYPIMDVPIFSLEKSIILLTSKYSHNIMKKLTKYGKFEIQWAVV